ncbi:DUF1990 family protein [Luteimicrobium album]|uniref:DUF1990 family protein n=1 Tax=Luteimicrobium album TaxID=1054550 RepID=UPI0024E0A53D|nr:DUF1990 family protein [Luteimicrobium album]
MNDTGTSACFHLTPREEAAVRSAVTMAGGAATDLVTLEAAQLARRDRSYDVVGATTPGTTTWQPPDGWRAYERSVCLGSGPELWHRASSEVLRWGVKTRSGFLVAPELEPGTVARRGDRLWLTAHIGPLRVREPVEVVEVVETSHRTALAYGTLVGHPVTDKEAFIVGRDKDGNVTLTLRSITHAGRGRWWVLFPAALVAQQLYRRRYLRALAAH